MSNFGRIVISEGETGADAPVESPESSGSPANQPNNLPSEGNVPTDRAGLPSEGSEGGDNGGERPAWLPEKFKSAEELAKAYSELEKKFSQPKADEQKTEPKKEEASKPVSEEGESPKLDEPVADPSKVDLDPFHQEWEQKGELSEESFSKLEKMGFPKELVQQYITGFQATQEREAQSIYRETGGEDGYRAMVEWAAKTLPPDEIKAYDALVTRGDVNAAKVAAKGLYAQYVAANGSAPKLIGGKASGDSSIAPFRSSQEVVKAMSDPRYTNDPAYRKDVEKRLEISSVL